MPGERRLVPPLTTTKTYTAGYERDVTDDAWNVRIKGIPGCQSYGRSIRQAQQRIREALAIWLDRELALPVIRDQFPAALSSVADEVVRARSAAVRADAKAHQQTVDAVRTLTDQGLGRRDAAELLGLSHQRVQQLLVAS